MKVLEWFRDVGLFSFIDIAFMSFLLYVVIVWVQKAKAAFVLRGILIIAFLYILAQQFNLSLTVAVFQGFFTVILVAVIVIFQEEIKHFFEQVALWSMNRRIVRRKSQRLLSTEVETLVRVLADFARKRIGALIVIRGQNMILRYLEGGINLDGKLSAPLLESLFDTHSNGHDGAAIIEKSRIAQFGCHLPLSKSLTKMEHTGTRHCAALGLSELTDALCLVVSEERGVISVARFGQIRPVKDPEELNGILERFYQETNPEPKSKPWSDFFQRNYKEKVLALFLALLLWIVNVQGSSIVYKTLTVPVQYAKLPEGLAITQLDPKEAEVTLSGPQKDFYFFNDNRIKIVLKTWQVKENTAAIRLSPSDVSYPKQLVLENVSPRKVDIKIEKVVKA